MCGYLSYVVTALVEGKTPVDDDDTARPPLPGVQVCWTPSAGELYKPSDVPTEVPPQNIPYCEESNDYGLSEVKYRIPLPVRCGVVKVHEITADIGVSSDSATITVTVDAPPPPAR